MPINLLFITFIANQYTEIIKKFAHFFNFCKCIKLEQKKYDGL